MLQCKTPIQYYANKQTVNVVRPLLLLMNVRDAFSSASSEKSSRKASKECENP